jgi:hypothetical protein
MVFNSIHTIISYLEIDLSETFTIIPGTLAGNLNPSWQLSQDGLTAKLLSI